MTVLCSAPFVEVFLNPAGGYRNCCVADPQIISSPDQSVMQWWTSDEMHQFRQRLTGSVLPDDCHRCELQERNHGHSMRIALNQEHTLVSAQALYPARWNIIFGNLCNLACWTCSENSSSLIASHKKKIGILPKNSGVSTQDKFIQQWPSLREQVLESYQHHDVVTITILGGEPLYNKLVCFFLQELIEKKLNHRTKLEFHTNATIMSKKIQRLFQSQSWKYVCIFMSIDAVGKKAEWLRYGSDWSRIQHNLPKLSCIANYTEIHCTLSVLNLGDVLQLQEFCDQNQFKLKIMPLSQPKFMCLKHWDGDPNDLIPPDMISDQKYQQLISLVGKEPLPGSKEKLRKYIKSFDAIRSPLRHFDSRLADILEL